MGYYDCLRYVGLYIAMRRGNWNLRMCCMKKMEALFTAYDRTAKRTRCEDVHYQAIKGQHCVRLLHFFPYRSKAIQNQLKINIKGTCTVVCIVYYAYECQSAYVVQQHMNKQQRQASESLLT